MKLIALSILTLATLRQAIRAMLLEDSKEDNKLALIMFPTVVLYLMSMGVI